VVDHKPVLNALADFLDGRDPRTRRMFDPDGVRRSRRAEDIAAVVDELILTPLEDWLDDVEAGEPELREQAHHLLKALKSAKHPDARLARYKQLRRQLSILRATAEALTEEDPRGRWRVLDGPHGWTVTTETGVPLGVVTKTGPAPNVRYRAQTREPNPCALMFGRGWIDKDRSQGPRGFISVDTAADALYDAVVRHRYAWSTTHEVLVPFDMA
jgi:hypothetical protein